MLRQRTALLACVSCAALLGGCGTLLGLSDFEDGATGASGTSSTTSTGSAGGGGQGSTTSTSSAGGGGSGQGGSGGSGGGGGSAITCVNQGEPFDVIDAATLTPTDGNPHSIDDKSLIIVRDPGQNRVHVSITDEGAQNMPGDERVWVRTVVDDQGSPLANLASYTDPGNYPRVVDATVASSKLVFAALQGEDIVSLSFPLQNGNQGVMEPATVTTVTTPDACKNSNNGHARNLKPAFAADGTFRYAVTCDDNQDATRALYIGPTVDLIGSGVKDGMGQLPLDLQAQAYLYNQGTHFLWSGPDFGGGVDLRWGPTAADLQQKTTLALSQQAHAVGVFSLIDAPSGDGLAMLAIQIPPLVNGQPVNLVPATVWSGVVPTASYGDLGQAPPPELFASPPIDQVDDIGLYEAARSDGTTIVTAGADFSATTVRYLRLDAQAKPIVSNHVVYTGQGVTVLRAHAAQLSPLLSIVVWAEKSGNDVSVKGRRLFCF